jgi:hypothetical protein
MKFSSTNGLNYKLTTQAIDKMPSILSNNPALAQKKDKKLLKHIRILRSIIA